MRSLRTAGPACKNVSSRHRLHAAAVLRPDAADVPVGGSGDPRTAPAAGSIGIGMRTAILTGLRIRMGARLTMRGAPVRQGLLIAKNVNCNNRPRTNVELLAIFPRGCGK